MNQTNYILACKGLTKNYREGEKNEVSVLQNLSLGIKEGERVAIVGASGSGKSTLLHLLGGLDAPSFGDVFLMGQKLSEMSDAKRGQLRNAHLGFVYQFHHLLPEFSALENVAMPLLIRRMSEKEALQKAAHVLNEVGLGHRLTHTPAELSGGERQRAAIARALVTEPACVLADEPTGNLDRQSAANIFDLMLKLNAAKKTSFIIVTHDLGLANKADRVLQLEDGNFDTRYGTF